MATHLLVLSLKISYPFIKEGKLEKRDYQLNIARSCSRESSLVVIPTGMGKTIIAVLVMAARLEEFKNSKEKKILFLAPTKPLADQHYNFIKEFMDVEEEKIVLFTGKVSPARREKQWSEKEIIVATPQVIQNDLISRRIDLKDVILIVFDEAHRAVGDYAYVYIAKKYREQAKEGHYQVLGITASPGSQEERIVEVCKHLYISNIEIRSEYDPDVLPYIHEIEIKWHLVKNPPQIQKIIQLLNEIYLKYLKRLKKFGLLNRTHGLTKKELLDVQRKIQEKIRSSKKPPRAIFTAASAQSAAIKVGHAIELLETQGVTSLREYVDRLEKEALSRSGSKGAKILYNEDKFQYVLSMLREAEETHPKIPVLVNIIRRQLRMKMDSKILVFAHYRDTAAYLEKRLNQFEGIKASRFVGQAKRGKDKGFSQKKQIETIQMFKDKNINVLIATSVAEEGLDIPSTDLVVFYEPIPSEIRTIQRRGRTGRQAPGRVEILITRGTRDEAYYWSSKTKERRMKMHLNLFRKRLIERIKEELSGQEMAEMEVKRKKVEVEEETKEAERKRREDEQTLKKGGQASLFDFDGMLEKGNQRGDVTSQDFSVVVDNREFGSSVVKFLVEIGVKLEARHLHVGDYVVSSRIGIERKEVRDFLSSLMDGRLFSQLVRLSTAYPNPILIIEGKEDLFRERHIRPSSIYGSFASLLVDLKIPVIRTRDQRETAELIHAIIKREHSPERKIAVRPLPAAKSLRERQRYVVEGLPNVSVVLAERLLKHFGSVRAIFEANEKEWMKVKGVGKKTAREIKEVLDEEYR